MAKSIERIGMITGAGDEETKDKRKEREEDVESNWAFDCVYSRYSGQWIVTDVTHVDNGKTNHCVKSHQHVNWIKKWAREVGIGYERRRRKRVV